MEKVPEFRGKAFLRDSSETYAVYAYQYATTSVPQDDFSPAVNLYAEDEKDVSMAIRSSGHQYIGASSTKGPIFKLS